MILITVSCSSTVVTKLQTILEEYHSLLDIAELRRSQLQQQYQLFQYLMEAGLIEAWLDSKKTIADGNDFGQDLEGIKVIIFCRVTSMVLLLKLHR